MPIALGEGASRCRAPQTPETPTHVLAAWREYKSGGSVAARNQLVVHYMRSHVRPIASRIHGSLPNQVDLDDLVQQGYLGLIDAMDRFDLDRETRFETFSRRRIFGAIHDYLRSIDPVPRLSRTRSKRLQHERERFHKTHGRPPTDDELRGALDLPEPILIRLLTERRPAAIVSFSNVQPEAGGNQEDSDAMHAFEDRLQPGPVLTAERRDLQRWITRGFDQRDRLIIILYYYEQMTMSEVGRTVGISESRVSQRLESIVACLRSRLAALGAEHEFVLG